MKPEIEPGEWRVRSDEEAFQDLFAEQEVLAGCLPNLVLPTGPRPLQILMDLMEARAGVMYLQPPHDEEGNPYYGSLDEGAEFRLWNTPANQGELVNLASHPQLGCLTIVLDQRVSDDCLQRYRDARDPDESASVWFDLPCIVEFISCLRWAYFPLSDEYPLAMFLTRETDAHYVESLEGRLKAEALPSARIVEEAGKYTWHLPHELRVACQLTGE